MSPSEAAGDTPAKAHLAADLMIVQASYIMGVQTIVSRDVPAVEAAVVSVGYISGGSSDAPNVMPAELSLGGTVRCFSKETQQLLGRRMEQLAVSLSAAYGGGAEVRLTWVTPPLVNAPEQAEIVARAAAAAVGPEHVITDMPPITGGEDFAHMIDTTPGGFVFLGNGIGPDGKTHNVHTPTYDFNDSAIPPGVAYWVSLVSQQLRSANTPA